MAARVTGVTLAEFDQLTPLELTRLIEQHNEREHNEWRRHAELHRLLSMQISNAIVASAGGRALEDPRRFLLFAWEDDPHDEIDSELLETNWDVLDNIYINNN